MFILTTKVLAIKLFYSSAIVRYYPRAKLNIIFELQYILHKKTLPKVIIPLAKLLKK